MALELRFGEQDPSRWQVTVDDGTGEDRRAGTRHKRRSESLLPARTGVERF